MAELVGFYCDLQSIAHNIHSYMDHTKRVILEKKMSTNIHYLLLIISRIQKVASCDVYCES